MTTGTLESVVAARAFVVRCPWCDRRHRDLLLTGDYVPGSAVVKQVCERQRCRKEFRVVVG